MPRTGIFIMKTVNFEMYMWTNKGNKKLNTITKEQSA